MRLVALGLVALSVFAAKPAAKKVVAKVPVTAKAAAPKPVSFRLDVMPVLFRAGCNSGGCHGAASGKDGFHLSLFGYDPAGDYYRLTQQMVGRRVDLAAPAESLLLLKATGKVPHSGGRRFAPTSPYYETLLRWIEAGAPDDGAAVAQVTGIALVPDKIVFTGKETKRPIEVVAKYSDGTTRVVNPLALYLTNNKGTADISDQGVVTAGKPGATFVFARFAKYTMGAEVIVLPKDKFVWPKLEARNYIDEAVYAKLKNLHILPSKLATDEEFLRRVTLDLTGLLPTPAESAAFAKDTSAAKRAKVVDELMSREAFADLWATKWAETLKITTEGNGQFGTDRKAAFAYYEWIREQMKRNTPLDEFVRAQVSSSGSNFEDPAVNLYTMLPQGQYDAKAVAQDVAQVFTGVRIQCAQCHNHPFDRWTQDDYYSFVSFFTGVKRKTGSEVREYLVWGDANAAPAKHLLDNRPMPARFLGGDAPNVKDQDARMALAEWLTSKDNVLFRENLANRIWAHFFGRGIVDPVDDVRISNPPSNRELLTALGQHLASYGYDAKKLIRDICLSRTYQLSAVPNATNKDDETQFSHAHLRRLRADVLLDAIDAATGTKSTFGNYPAGLRAIQLYEGFRRTGNYFLKTFGAAARDSVNASETRLEPTLAQTLHLVNGDTLENKLERSTVVTDLLKAKKAPGEILDVLYLRALGRKPSVNERKKMEALLAGKETDRKTYNDIFWALLNSTEFAFNH